MNYGEMKKAAILVMFLLVAAHASAAGPSQALEEFLVKGSSLTYQIVHRTPTGEVKEYYTVMILDKFLGSQGMMYTVKVTYLGLKTITATQTLPEYNLIQVLPLPAGLGVDDIRSKGFGTIYMPVPVFDLIPRADLTKPYAYASINMKLVTVTTYVLNLTRVVYRIKALRLHTTYRGYSTTAYIEEKTGLLLRMSFVNPKTNNLEYEVLLVFASNIEALVNKGGTPAGEGVSWSNLIPLMIVLTILTVSVIVLIIAVRKVSRMIT